MNIQSIEALSDGRGEEGLGALGQYQLMGLAQAQFQGIEFRFEPLRNIRHYEENEITAEEYAEDINNLFGFRDQFNKPDESTVFVSEHEVMGLGQSNLQRFLPILRKQKLHLAEEDKYFNPKDLNVAIHLRVYTSTDYDQHPVREYFNSDGAVSMEYYANIISQLEVAYPDQNLAIHIYSQGKEEDFQMFESLHSNVNLHIEEYPPISLYHMANADILLMANSSLSYVAHLYGRAFTIARETFHHTLYDDTHSRADRHGKFDMRKLPKYE